MEEITLDEFRLILVSHQIEIPEDLIATFRDLAVAQADTILDSWIKEKMNND
jgi:hypothetical protein